MREEVEELKKEVKEIKEETLAIELLKDQRKQNKRLFIIIIVVLCMWFSTLACGVYYITHYTYEEEIITETANTDNGGNACIGDRCNNGEINYGNGNESN